MKVGKRKEKEEKKLRGREMAVSVKGERKNK